MEMHTVDINALWQSTYCRVQRCVENESQQRFPRAINFPLPAALLAFEVIGARWLIDGHCVRDELRRAQNQNDGG